VILVKERIPLSMAGKLTIFSLVAAAAGVVIQIVSGVDYPTIPPGLFILLIPAGLVAFGRWRWTPVIATLAGLFIFVSYFLSGSTVRLLDLSQFGAFIGLWLQFLAVIVTVVAGMVATMQNYRAPAMRR
jgi:hypothetical protein